MKIQAIYLSVRFQYYPLTLILKVEIMCSLFKPSQYLIFLSIALCVITHILLWVYNLDKYAKSKRR